MAQQFQLQVNGRALAVSVEPDTPLLYVLRNDAQLNGPKFGCGLGQCGACTVIVDGAAVRSCITPVSNVGKSNVVTLEGLGTLERPHSLQQAFIDEQAAQCGYCTSGMILTAKALLDRNPQADLQAIKSALEGNLCRCGTQLRVMKAVQRVAAKGSSPK
jgi:nicotinate dehydrogenase subunit A